MRTGRDEKVQAHFIGSIVYVERGLSSVTSQEALLVIDGQQRLTTTSLFIAALAEHFEAEGLPELLDAFSAKKLRNYYLLNPDEEGEQHYKLILSQTDKDTLLAILQKAPKPAQVSSRILENYELFKQLIADNKSELESICQGLAKLVIVDVSLDRAQDNPQLIFESMNSTGLELSQADLIRNFILMGLVPRLQTELYKNYWRPMELAFGQAAYVEHFDAFMRHYLTAKTGEVPNLRDVYVAFKRFALVFGDARTLVADIHAYASYYCAIALGAEPDTSLKQAFHDLRELKVDVSYPFLLDVYHDLKQARISVSEVHEIVRLVESYVFRRTICGIPPNSLGRIFAGLAKTIRKDRYLESVQATFILFPSYRRFPDTAEFEQKIKLKDLYNFRSRNYWPRRLENHERKERVIVEEYSIEHVMPQNEFLSQEWQTELGSDWQRVQRDWLHTLGNLTLTGYNSEYSDRAFSYKRNLVTDAAGNPVGLAHSPLKLNRGFGQVKEWNEKAIKDRADRLAAEASKVWAAPHLTEEVLNVYRPEAINPGQQYSLNDHPHLLSGAMQEVFTVLRQSILALDPCVCEEFLKRYVAYKAETNFVDLVPQAKRLLLALNMSFADIEDPKALCRNVSEISHWGNGEVEISLKSKDELPYVMGLIRQAFDRQMGDPQDA